MFEPSRSPAIELSGFELLRRLGAGGMAEVFLAKKRGAEGTYKLLVLKRILPEHASSRRFREMFVVEAQLATRLNHPNIVQIYEFAHHGKDGLLLSMEYVEGVDLGRLIRAAGKHQVRIDPWVSAFIVAEVAKGLHYAHERKDEGGLPLGIVHRDVSPQNILISYGGVVKIADFGIATANLFRDEIGVLKGKAGYMSPEQARGEKVDRRGDVYGLGVVLYELLSLRSPYGNLKEEALAQAVRQGMVLPLSGDVPPQLCEIAMCALGRAPADRYQSARELAAAIGRALLARQQLVDGASVEETIAALLGRAAAGPPELVAGVPEPQQTQAAVRKARGSAPEESDLGTAAHYSKRPVREVRHVAVVTLRLDGLAALEQERGGAAAERASRATRATLDDIAFKRGARFVWRSPTEAVAVVGLMENPSHAAQDAAMLAVDAHEALAGLSADLPVPIRAAMGLVRGIAAGERDEQGRLVGHELQEPAPYLAAQLGAQTPVGRTWVAGGVYRLVRREFRWSDGPSLELADSAARAVPSRMRVYALLRPITGDERLAELAAAPGDLVGRDAEKADLHAAYHRCVHRAGPSVPPPPAAGPPQAGLRPERPTGEAVARVVVGEMGIGKSALCDAFVAELPREALVVRVECSPVRIDLPYATLGDLLREALGVGAEVSFAQALEKLRQKLGVSAPDGKTGRLLARLAELASGNAPAQDEDAASYEHELVLRAVRVLFGSLARQQPVVIAIDGVQWADRASLQLLARVLARPEPLPILTLLVTRPDERVAPFLEGLMRIELRGLDSEEQVRLVQARLGVREGVAAVCRELVPRVGGNPFFLLELVEALLERGALEIADRPIPGGDEGSAGQSSDPVLLRHEDRIEQSPDALPGTVEQLVGDRLRELPAAEHDVVEWLAVAGGPLSDADLLALTRLADDEALSRLCARGLCERRGRAVDFRHPLVREVAYQGLDPVRRARMHRRLGEHLSTSPIARGLSAAIVAGHLQRGEAPGQAAEFYLEAAGAARDAHQTGLALRYFARALELLPAGDSRHMAAHEALEAISRHLGRRAERLGHLRRLCELARESRQARWVGTALLRQARLYLDEGRAAQGLPTAERAAALARLAGQPEAEVEALVLRCELLRDLGDSAGALDACERALQVASAGQVGARVRAEVLRTKGVMLRRAGRLSAALEAHAEAIAVFEAVGARRREARARNALGFVLFVLGRYEDAIAMCLSSIAIDMMIGGRFQVAKTLSNVGMAYAALGDGARGLVYLQRAREAHERYDDHDGRIDTLLVTANVLVERGELGEAALLHGDARALAAVTGSAYDAVHERIVRALLLRARGEQAQAAAAAAEARQIAEAQSLVSYRVFATAIEAAARVAQGDVATGVPLATEALGAVEAMEGSEYGIGVRALCCDAMLRAAAEPTGVAAAAVPAMTGAVLRRAASHVQALAGHVREPALRRSFLARPPVRGIIEAAARVGDSGGADVPRG
ncbi:MAG: protein kinase [Deltaproteobacteria bacterium]|nr:protein kinase [Deltaproteobacteria bacterium]